jgi:hypothetical protein
MVIVLDRQQQLFIILQQLYCIVRVLNLGLRCFCTLRCCSSLLACQVPMLHQPGCLDI